jgi:ATP-dependent Zn protease
MNSTELDSISEDDIFLDINQSNTLLSNKNLLQKTQTSKNTVSYMSIVDSTDYLGCINNNCSKIECNCKPNERCECVETEPTVKGYNNNTMTKSNSNPDYNSDSNVKSSINTNSINSFTSKLIDFLFVIILIILITYIVYNKAADYLIYCLGITLVYIFYKMYSINM